MINTTTTVHPAPFELRLDPVYVVAVLCDASGRVITEANKANAFYIKTELFNCDDEALSAWDYCGEDALFRSVQDQHGESLV